MRKYAVVLLVLLVSLLGCGQPSVSVVTLESPANGSSVSSLTPILAWESAGESVSYRLQVATDGDFKNLIIDVSDLTNPSYSVPSGKLANGETYYWHVNASKGGQVSPWSTCWAFQTVTATGTMMVNATLDGSSWSGGASYIITGAKSSSGSSVSQSFSNLPAGSYTVSYSSGGPPGATLASITPSATQTLSSGGTITFTLNFLTVATSTLVVNATLNGIPWQGEVSYTVNGPKADSASSVPQSFSNLPAGSYTVRYVSHRSAGPPGANLASITPSPTQTLSTGGTITFTLNFQSEMNGTIRIKATLNGETWSGEVRYTITGPHSDIDYSVPEKLSNRPAGTYALVYNYGGPSGATLSSISPSATQTLSAGGTISFTLNFYSEASGTVEVNALLDGQPWRTALGSGTIRYGISGPSSDASTSMPDTFRNLYPGTYTLTYHSGGPIGATLISITPSSTQNLYAGGTIRFTLNFHSEAKGTVEVDALLNGEWWEGAVSYTVHGPYTDSSSYVPDSFSGCPAGSYTVHYNSGGPPGCVLTSISPSPTQNLHAGGTIRFTLNFTFQSM